MNVILFLRPSKVRKLVRTSQFQKYENGYRTKICDFTVRHSGHEITNPGWQAKMASIEFEYNDVTCTPRTKRFNMFKCLSSGTAGALLFIDFHCQIKRNLLSFIDDVRVRVCAEDGLKDSFFFCA